MQDSSEPPLASDSSRSPAAQDLPQPISTNASRSGTAHQTGQGLTRSVSLNGENDEKRGLPDVTFADSVLGQDVDKAGAKPDGGPHAAPSPSTNGGHPAGDANNKEIATSEDADAGAIEENAVPKTRYQRIMAEARRSFWLVITHTWLNALLVFVPVGIIAAHVDLHGGVVFAMNCISVIPLAGLLAFATESVAAEMGDALGALLNVTFGNAVELIIFIIALTQDKIRIVQASLLGSILANLLLILGMGFFLGGMRYREQIYNSTVTQMSACLLSLSVISLVLPTAFHASFSDPAKADAQSLKISRGTSVILLLVYGVYLLFQLKSHAYLYESTPQEIVDAEAHPGPAAGWLDSSSSDDSSSSSSDSDSSDSDHSRDTMKRKMKKVLRGGRRRKSSVGSADTDKLASVRNRSSSFISVGTNATDEAPSETSSSRKRAKKAAAAAADDSSDDDDRSYKRHFRRHKHKKRQKRHRRQQREREAEAARIAAAEQAQAHQAVSNGENEPRRVDFAVQSPAKDAAAANGEGNASVAGGRRPFPALRGMSVKNLAPPVFVQRPEDDVTASVPSSSRPVPRVKYGIRRTNSLPDHLGQHQQHQQHLRPPGAMYPPHIPSAALTGGTPGQDAVEDVDNGHLTKWASIILLLLTTGLVAYCAELLISSIEAVTENSSVGEIFIGLIILPIVGNAAEHVTAITVAMKNKMDLAIGVAVGSSIQIAIFITPLVVILGWIMDKEMTLYFTLFETVCLFVSAFMVNFLVLDGRSNYLEGALLCAVYLIISVVAFFYPDADEASQWGE